MVAKKILFFVLIITAVSICTFSMASSFIVPVGSSGDVSALEMVTGGVLGYLQWFAYAIAIGMLIYIGIKYTMASADGKADLKSAMIKYVIGAVLIGGAGVIYSMIFSAIETAVS